MTLCLLYSNSHPPCILFKLTHPLCTLFKLTYSLYTLFKLTYSLYTLFKLTYSLYTLFRQIHSLCTLYKLTHAHTHIYIFCLSMTCEWIHPKHYFVEVNFLVCNLSPRIYFTIFTISGRLLFCKYPRGLLIITSCSVSVKQMSSESSFSSSDRF